MKTYTFEGKTYEEAVSKAVEELKTTEENLTINVLASYIYFFIILPSFFQHIRFGIS